MIIKVITISGIILPLTGFAQWPIFSNLSPETVEQLITTAHCPAHEGYIPTGSKVRINNYYIPRDEQWYWYYEGAEKCEKLPENLQYVRYYQSGHTNGNFIETDYGVDQHHILFRFFFPITGLWYCAALYPSELPQKFSCAMDQMEL